MPDFKGLVLILASSTALADGYGLVVGEGPGTRPVGGAHSNGGYGLVPSAVERQGVQRVTREQTPSYGQATEKRYLSAASRTAYVVPAARPALQPATRPVRHQAAQPQLKVLASRAAAGSAGRYSQVQLDTRKSYSVSVSAERPLADLMRAPVTFAKPAPQPVRSLSQLQTVAPAVASTQPVLPANIAATRLPSGAQADQPDFSALKARLKQTPVNTPAPTLAIPPTSIAVATAASSLPDFSALKARLKKPAAVTTTSTVKPVSTLTSTSTSTSTSASASASVRTATGGANFSALKARLKHLPATADAKPQLAVKASSESRQRRTSALPGHAGRRSTSPNSSAADVPVALAPVTTTARNRGGINGMFDAVASLLGAESVKPWQKAKLAEQAMKKGGAIPALSKFSQKVHISKEASRGGYGVAGGGCGCN